MKHLIPGILLLASIPAVAQQSVDTTRLGARVFRLGEVTVRGQRLRDSSSIVTSQQIEAFNRLDAGRALNLVPGVTLAAVGPRNESTVFVRGFDLRQVPVFIDGIPVYVPFDGYVDLARFTTFDLASIQVDKGFSSVTYGANTLGGAINLVSRRPDRPLELETRTGWLSGQGSRLSLNAGSRLGKFYAQAGLSQLRQNTFPLSNDFAPHPLEQGGGRDNAYRRDAKYSLKVGYVPNATDEYALSYINQQGRKGNPPYLGADPLQRARFWQWPDWDKQSLYFISNTAAGPGYVKTRLYYDAFTNSLFGYDDNTYTTQLRPAAFRSFYRDHGYGGSAEYGRDLGAHQLKAAAHYKFDQHRERNEGEPWRRAADYTASLGVEDAYRPAARLTLLPGLSYQVRRSRGAQNYNTRTQEITDFPTNDNGAFNAQLGAQHALSSAQELHLSVARKSRFATIKDRYSYRLGQALPNPDLEPERATHYEAGYAGAFLREQTLKLRANVFVSRLTDVIQQVNNVQPNVFQLQNAGRAQFHGAELSADYAPARGVHTGAQYSYIRRENRSNPELKFTDVPEHKVFAFAGYRFRRRASVLASYEYNDARYSTSYGIRTPGYYLVNLQASLRLHRYVSLEGGVNNVLDKNYALVEGFPEAGRNYFATLVISNL